MFSDLSTRNATLPALFVLKPYIISMKLFAPALALALTGKNSISYWSTEYFDETLQLWWNIRMSDYAFVLLIQRQSCSNRELHV